MKTDLEQLHYKSNQSLDSDKFLKGLHQRIDRNQFNKKHNQGMLVSLIAIVLLVFNTETIDVEIEVPYDYFSVYANDTTRYEMMVFLADNNIEFEE